MGPWGLTSILDFREGGGDREFMADGIIEGLLPSQHLISLLYAGYTSY